MAVDINKVEELIDRLTVFAKKEAIRLQNAGLIKAEAIIDNEERVDKEKVLTGAALRSAVESLGLTDKERSLLKELIFN